MSKNKNILQPIVDQAQETVNALALVTMMGAAVLGTVELAETRERVVIPAHSNVPFSNVYEQTPVTTDHTLRREKENEVGAHGSLHTVYARTQSRAGKQ